MSWLTCSEARALRNRKCGRPAVRLLDESLEFMFCVAISVINQSQFLCLGSQLLSEQTIVIKGEEGDLAALGIHDLHFYLTPGHSPGLVLWLHKPSNYLLAGDFTDVVKLVGFCSDSVLLLHEADCFLQNAGAPCCLCISIGRKHGVIDRSRNAQLSFVKQDCPVYVFAPKHNDQLLLSACQPRSGKRIPQLGSCGQCLANTASLGLKFVCNSERQGAAGGAVRHGRR